MTNKRLHLPSAVLGAVLVFGLAVTIDRASAQKPATASEYRVVSDLSESDLQKLSEEGWDYVGYLGESLRGDKVDETLWKRPER